jgi:hypothetical protein
MKNKKYLAVIGALIVVVLVIWYLEGSDSAQSPAPVVEAEQNVSAQTAAKPQAQKPRPATQSSSPATNPASTPAAAPSAPKLTYINADADDIFIVLPRPGDSVSPLITISGTARGDWFQQGTFTAEVIASNGDVLVRNQIPAKGNYMTTEMVQFSSQVQVPPNHTGPMTVVLRNDNPAGHPIPDRSVSMPVVVK